VPFGARLSFPRWTASKDLFRCSCLTRLARRVSRHDRRSSRGARGRRKDLLATQGTLVAVRRDPVPDAQGVALPGLAFGGAGALGDPCVLDATGRLLFRARMTGGTQTGATERAYFYGSSRADLRMVVRGGDQAPSLASGVDPVLRGGGLAPLTRSVRLLLRRTDDVGSRTSRTRRTRRSIRRTTKPSSAGRSARRSASCARATSRPARSARRSCRPSRRRCRRPAA
jgi:hypothetical protein